MIAGVSSWKRSTGSRWLRGAALSGVLFSAIPLGLFTIPLHAQAPGRKALVIGNADYRAIGVLRTPARDAAAIEAALRKLRFETTLVENATLEGIAASIEKFAKSLRAGDAAFFYYAGYSVQSTDENYLLPVNFDPAVIKDIDYVAYSVSRILSDLEARKPGFLAFLLDGAWDHPALRRRFPDSGFARLEPRAQGVFVGFSAGTGRPNYDDHRSPLSLYAKAVVEALDMQGLTLSQIAETVKRLVSNASENRQIPTEASTVIQDFFVNPKPPDLLAWEKLKDSQDPVALERFRTSFPSSPFAAEAAAKLEEMDWLAARAKGRSGLEAFLARYPAGRYTSAARRELDSFLQADRVKGSEQLVLDLLKRYKTAMEDRDVDQLQKLWPSLSKQQVTTFKAFFRDARSIHIEAQPSTPPEVSGDAITVRVKRSIQYTGQAAQNDTIALRMRRNGEALTIEGVSVDR